MAEIGSEFWDVPVVEKPNGLFPDNTQWFLSGRSALNSIILELKDCRTVAMPAWCCDSMIKPFVDAEIEVGFIPMHWGGRLEWDIDHVDADILFLMDYFGYAGSGPKTTGFDGIVIRDVTHSVFSCRYDDADYYFGSLRKWCGVWTGGYAWTQSGKTLAISDDEVKKYVDLRMTAMELKRDYIAGRISDKGYLKVFEEAEDLLDKATISPAAKRDVEIAGMLDADIIRRKRRENAEILREELREWLIFPDMREEDCPLFVPVIVPNKKRDALRKELVYREIYCPIHWPLSEYHDISVEADYIYNNELSLVCDQRYSVDDMKRIACNIKAFMEN